MATCWTITELATEPPTALDAHRLPCVACGRFQPLDRLRRAHLQRPDGQGTATVLVCLDCATERSQLELSIRGSAST